MADENQPTPDVGNTGVSGDVADIMAFDPFGPSEDGNPGDNKGASAAPKEEVNAELVDGGGKPSTPPEPAKPAVQAPSAESPEVVALKKALADSQAALEATKPSGQAPAAPAQPQGGPQPDVLPEYMFNFPDPLIAALNSEDPRDQKIGLTTMTRGIARGIHSQVMNDVMTRVMPAVIQGAVRAVEAKAMEQREVMSMRDDFYGKYKEFDSPSLKPIISQLSIQLARELGVQGWGPEFRDALAERARAVLKTATSPAPKPPAMTNGSGGGRPGASSDSDTTKQIMELF